VARLSTSTTATRYLPRHPSSCLIFRPISFVLLAFEWPDARSSTIWHAHCRYKASAPNHRAASSDNNLKLPSAPVQQQATTLTFSYRIFTCWNFGWAFFTTYNRRFAVSSNLEDVFWRCWTVELWAVHTVWIPLLPTFFLCLDSQSSAGALGVAGVLAYGRHDDPALPYTSIVL
jgi:hypothetical protein